MSEEKCEACNAGYGIELNRCHGYTHAQAAIQRVRELAETLESKEAFHQLTAYACAQEIRKALDGEQ